MSQDHIDLYGKAGIKTTIQGIDQTAYNWVELASDKVDAASGKDYVKLNRGVLTVDHLNHFLKTIPLEISFTDSNQQFLFYNYKNEAGDMIIPRQYKNVGDTLGNLHPKQVHGHTEDLIRKMKSHQEENIQQHIPSDQDDEWIVRNYQGLYDEEGEYMGMISYTQNILPLVNYYLEHTGHILVPDEEADSSKTVPAAGGQYRGGAVDGNSAASK